MKILMLSTDPAIAVAGSDVQKRMQEYAGLFDELHVVTIHASHSTIQNDNLFVYPVSGRFGMYKRGKGLCQHMKFDVITTQSPDEIGLIGWLLARKFHIPFQVQIHTDIFSPWYRDGSWKEYIRFLISRFLIPRANCLRVVSERIKRSLSHTLISVLPIYTDTSRFLNAERDPKIDERFRDYDFKMISVGRFVDKEKNFTMLIEMMREFISVCPRVLLVLVGDGVDKKKYEVLIAKYKLEKYVTIESLVHNLPSFLKSFDLFLSSSNYEGWGRVVIEAMAAGLPVVMTDVGLAGEVLRNGENGIVVPVGDRKTMLEACTFIFRNPEKRKEFMTRGREAIMQFPASSQ